jgi:hypothetical protein
MKLESFRRITLTSIFDFEASQSDPKKVVDVCFDAVLLTLTHF